MDRPDLRDYFASAALPVMMCQAITTQRPLFFRLRLALRRRFPKRFAPLAIHHEHDPAGTARICYEYADAMLAERAKVKP